MTTGIKSIIRDGSTRRFLAIVQAVKRRIRLIPKYFVRAAQPTIMAAMKRSDFLFSKTPFIHRKVAHTQKQSIKISHISVVLDSRTTGVRRVISTASKGREQ